MCHTDIARAVGRAGRIPGGGVIIIDGTRGRTGVIIRGHTYLSGATGSDRSGGEITTAVTTT